MWLAIIVQARNDAEQYEKRRVLMFDWGTKMFASTANLSKERKPECWV
jgi:hypothetical protein